MAPRSSSGAGGSRRIPDGGAGGGGIGSENLLRLPVGPADGEVMLSEQDRAEFAERGIIWLRGAFSPDEAARMRRRVWARLARLGAAEDGPATWTSAGVTGLSKAIKRDSVFAALGSPVIRGAVHDLLRQDAWAPPREWGTVPATFDPEQRVP